VKAGVPLRSALRVATAATVALAVIYVVVVVGILTLVSGRLLNEADGRLDEQLLRSPSAGTSTALPGGLGDADDAPVYFWRVSSGNVVTSQSPGAPGLPPQLLARGGRFPRTVTVSHSSFRFDAVASSDGSRLFAAESLAEAGHVRSLLIASALVVSPVLFAGVFVSAFIIGRQASKPVEVASRRQREFTADASHELRTPLTVIQAEVGLALAATRTADGYRDALQRVSDESQRLRRIVDDLLWLARFDAEPPPPQTELVDVATMAQVCADRFAPILVSRSVELEVDGSDRSTQIAAAPEWIDRLVGVLLDNAIRHARSPGWVMMAVDVSANEVTLTIADDGDGIPVAERGRLFDRFHRIDNATGQGAGLGLAIADAVVRTTHGRWTVDDSARGGASMSVSWPRPRHRGSSS